MYIDIFPDDENMTVGMRTYAHIREKILSLEWEPGVRVSEKDVAASMGVSKTPVREAFIRLAEESLLEIRPQSGSYVSEICFEKVYESLMLRRAIEMTVAQEAAIHRTAFDLVTMQDLIERQAAAAEAGDGHAFFQLDRDFHRELIRIAKMPSAMKMIWMVRGTVDRVQRLRNRKGQNRYPQVIAAHRAIVDAMKRRDGEEASQEMANHLNCMEFFEQIIRSPEVQKLVTQRAS